MKITKKLVFILIMTLIVWVIQIIYLLQRNASMPVKISSEAKRKRMRIITDYQKIERQLREKYEREKYQATGKTVYDRIFNTPGQSIIELIQNIARESLPEHWNSEVKVEEFTHFILLIYLPHNAGRKSTTQIATYFGPILKYCSSYVSDIAVFDRSHKAYLFFDNDTLQHIKSGEILTPSFVERTESQGDSFTQFNSITIQCEKLQSHLILPVEVSGTDGVVTCVALFDTGASITVFSDDVILRTGYVKLTDAPRKTFNTANGWMSCPIVHREVNIGGFRKTIEVAVNQRDELNLLGMNYFEGMKYIVDFSNSCIYVWKE